MSKESFLARSAELGTSADEASRRWDVICEVASAVAREGLSVEAGMARLEEFHRTLRAERAA